MSPSLGAAPQGGAEEPQRGPAAAPATVEDLRWLTGAWRTGDAEGTFDVYGLAQADAIYDFGRVNPDWRDGFRPSKIANPEGEYGSDPVDGEVVRFAGGDAA